MQINIIRCLPAKAMCLWLVQLALTQEIGMSLFSCFSSYILCRLAHHKDCISNSLLILQGDEFVFVCFTEVLVCHTLTVLQQGQELACFCSKLSKRDKDLTFF